MYHNYNEDVKEDNTAEQIVRRDIEALGASFLKWNDENDKYDLAMEMHNKVLTFAIKLDNAEKEKDFFIEYQRNGSRSFLDKTEASILTFVFPNLNEIWYVQTAPLEDLIHKSNTIQNALNKDGSAKGWVIARNKLKPLAMIRPITDKDTKPI